MAELMSEDLSEQSVVVASKARVMSRRRRSPDGFAPLGVSAN
jgi:hypothetical protein